MGGNGSTARKVSFGLDEDEKVTVIEGVKLSEDVLRRMRESRGSDSSKPPQSLPDSQKPPPSAKPSGPSTKEMQEEMRKNFERQQAMVKEQLARLAQRETETAAVTGLDELTSALITEKGRSFEEQEKAKILTLDNYKEVAEQYNLAASKAEARIRSRHTAFLCAELQAKVLQCYRENPQQTLHCSSLAKQYMTCVHQAKQSALTNHG
ncbi:coiled-coil-helix-coiled-coil-helix domain containing 6b isoform X3 [Archocentrus centrarchus]|uniref:coiled-coil-helix-coiled-coil-helix domain containing 6b isoform X3 n=1 Tax=Archocentrus centrarchus TaxID=63155 RepID=UPI0011EA0586|nr:MICOS complex subunit mic25a-like isoform X3 [Archocentrus centrarchus]